MNNKGAHQLEHRLSLVSTFVFTYLKVAYLNLLVSVAVQTGFSVSLPETRRQVFLQQGLHVVGLIDLKSLGDFISVENGSFVKEHELDPSKNQILNCASGNCFQK